MATLWSSRSLLLVSIHSFWCLHKANAKGAGAAGGAAAGGAASGRGIIYSFGTEEADEPPGIFSLAASGVTVAMILFLVIYSLFWKDSSRRRVRAIEKRYEEECQDLMFDEKDGQFREINLEMMEDNVNSAPPSGTYEHTMTRRKYNMVFKEDNSVKGKLELRIDSAESITMKIDGRWRTRDGVTHIVWIERPRDHSFCKLCSFRYFSKLNTLEGTWKSSDGEWGKATLVAHI